MSDQWVAEMHRCLGILLARLESSYEMQLRRYHPRYPQQEQPGPVRRKAILTSRNGGAASRFN